MINQRMEEIEQDLRNLGFDIDLENKQYQEAITYFSNKNDKNGLIHWMSQKQNCGGYALEIPVCIWPVKNYTFEEKVLRLLELFPFVRLLSSGELQENEYVVLYRANEKGHHFIKMTEKGEWVEKNGGNLPQKFNDWGNLNDRPQVAFAVLKQEERSEQMKQLPQCQRDVYLNRELYKYTEDGYTEIRTKDAKSPETFEEKLKQAYRTGKSSFVYLDKKFDLKVKKDEKDLIYLCDEHKVLGSVCTDGQTCILEVEDENEIYGFSANIPNLSKKKEQDLEIE